MSHFFPRFIHDFLDSKVFPQGNSLSRVYNALFSYSQNFPEYTNLEELCFRNRIDLNYEFDFFDSTTPEKIRVWLKKYGLRELGLEDLNYLAPPLKVVDGKDRLNVIGINRSDSGVGVSAINFIKLFENNNLLNSKIFLNISDNPNNITLNSDQYSPPIKLGCRTLFFINSDLMRATSHRFTKFDFFKTHKIGYWAWELEKVNPIWIDGLNFVDEIWCPSTFTKNALQTITKKKISVVPIPMYDESNNEELNVESDLKPKNYFLFIFDVLSCTERKNVNNLVRVFKEIYEQNSSIPKLIIKISNSDVLPNDLIELRQTIGNQAQNIQIIEEKFSRNRLNNLIKNAFFYISIHRAEGFGLTMAESMNLGTPVICTNYSGNLEFTTNSNSLLVGYTLVKPSYKAAPIYNFEGAFWAEPDLKFFKKLILQVSADPDLRQKFGHMAEREIKNTLSEQSVLARIRSQRLVKL